MNPIKIIHNILLLKKALMKAQFSSSVLKTSICIILCFFCLEIANSQTPLTKWITQFGEPQKSALVQYDYINNIKLIGLGLGTSSPSAKFHVRDVFSASPVFQSDVADGEGSIRHLFTDGTESYGIYQSGGTLKNKFAGSLELGDAVYT